MDGDFGVRFAILGAIVLLGVFMYFHITRSKQLVAKWADENGYGLLAAQYSWFLRGPYFWSSRGQVIYRVQVRDEMGLVRSGWVRCGSWFAGVFSDKVEGVLDA